MPIKKNWYEIVAPKYFKEQTVGETLAAEPKLLVGRTLSVSLADLEKDARKFYIKMNFQIARVDGKAFTIFTGHDTTSERIYRMVQHRTRRVDCVQLVQLKDGAKVRVKSILIIPRRVGTSVKDTARQRMKSAVEKILVNASLGSFIRMISDSSLQKAVKEDCKKIYPIGTVEIRKSEVLKQPEREIEEPVEKKEEAEEVKVEGAKEKKGEGAAEAGKEVAEETAKEAGKEELEVEAKEGRKAKPGRGKRKAGAEKKEVVEQTGKESESTAAGETREAGAAEQKETEVEEKERQEGADEERKEEQAQAIEPAEEPAPGQGKEA